MATLHILQRSDAKVLHIASSDDPAGCAAALGKDQAFEVTALTTFPGAGSLEDAVQWNLGAPLKGAWYGASVSRALAAVAEVLADDEPTKDDARP